MISDEYPLNAEYITIIPIRQLAKGNIRSWISKAEFIVRMIPHISQTSRHKDDKNAGIANFISSVRGRYTMTEKTPLTKYRKNTSAPHPDIIAVPASNTDAMTIPTRGDEKRDRMTNTGTNTHMVLGK
jgi:hypothetical protein